MSGPFYGFDSEDAKLTFRVVHDYTALNDWTFAEVGRLYGLTEAQCRAALAAHYRFNRGLPWRDVAEQAGYLTTPAAVMAVRRLFATPDGRPALPRWAKHTQIQEST